MIKTAIFVEGQSELIIVREFLLKWYDYGISLNCFNLFKKGSLAKAEYEFPNPKADKYFQIINVGNDNAVLQRLLDQEKYLFKNGFSKIIGLRDMYCLGYRKVTQDQGIREAINQKFIQTHQEQIKHLASNPQNINFHFAVMEIESWLWGLKNVFQKIDQRFTKDYILKHTGFDIEADDPETTLFHPSKKLTELFLSSKKSYNKSKGDVSSLESHIEKVDYQNLLSSNNCHSFKTFVSSVTV